MTSALPYVNYELHLGHLVGCLLPADVFSRFLRLNGEECIYVTGTDEYGTPVTVEAERQGMSPRELCDTYHAIQRESLKKFNLAFDIFSRTTAAEHAKLVQDAYYAMKQNNYIYKKDVDHLYCEGCKKFLPDRYVEGVCPHCGGAARGDQCENCGKLLEPTQLREPYCITCKAAPVVRKSTHVFFELPKLSERLRAWIEGNKHWFPNARNFSLAWIDAGLEDRCISRDMSWGVQIPDMPGKVFYVWFDAPFGYITFTKQLGRENWWKEGSTRIVHFIGKDNIAFHAIFFPGMLLAAGGYTLPHQVASYEFLNYEGKKFSKSKRVGVHVRDALELYPPDVWRYVLVTLLPEHRDSDFTWEDFCTKVNSDLNDTLGNFVHRTLTFTKNFCGGEVPEPGKLSKNDEKLLKTLEKAPAKVAKLMYDVKLREGLAEVMALARLGNQYLTAEEPWKNEGRRPAVIYVSLNVCSALSVLLEPFLPATAASMRKTLALPEKLAWAEAAKRLEPGRKIGGFSPLFRKVEQKEIDAYKKRFAGLHGHKEETKGGKPMIKYEDFDKLEIKVGVVEKAERIAGKTKLLKLSVDTGEKRTLVAGIGEQYAPEDLVGKRLVVLTNLEPKKIGGIESQGMLLAAEDGGKIAILGPDREVKQGSQVK